MRTRMGFGLLFGVALLLATDRVFADPPTGDISLDSFKKVEKGMTKQQVEEILGGPPSNEFHCGSVVVRPPDNFLWQNADCFISITFTKDERVLSGSLVDTRFRVGIPSVYLVPDRYDCLWDSLFSWLRW